MFPTLRVPQHSHASGQSTWLLICTTRPGTRLSACLSPTHPPAPSSPLVQLRRRPPDVAGDTGHLRSGRAERRGAAEQAERMRCAAGEAGQAAGLGVLRLLVTPSRTLQSHHVHAGGLLPRCQPRASCPPCLTRCLPADRAGGGNAALAGDEDRDSFAAIVSACSSRGEAEELVANIVNS